MRLFNFFILSILFGLLSAFAAADRDRIIGTVKDADSGEPIAGAIVRAGKGYASTDKGGKFMLILKDAPDSVSFRSMGYESVVLPISADFSMVRLSRKATQLNDVIVEAPDIYARGDTLVFNVSRYATAADNAIIDVIKRLPGIKVDDDGTIKYQGKPINKFYLDGNDFIGGQYGVATNNISAKDVKAVEVMENHQPVKALEGIEFPEEAGINLKLKEDARGRWVGVAKASAGAQPFLYDGSLFAMRLAPKVQNVFTLKADNTGWNPANEIREHNFNDMSFSDYSSSLWPEYISADIIDAPLTEKRTRDNLSWLANGITAFKNGDTSMRLKLNYMGDRLDYNSSVTTDYLSGDIPTFEKQDKLRTREHDLSAEFFSETNKREFYLKDRLTLNARWDNAVSGITGSFNLDQNIRRRNLSAVNDLKLVKRNEKRLFNLTSRNSFEYHPDRLTVAGEEDAVQKIGTTDFRSTTETEFGRLTRFWKFYLTAGLDLNYHRMNLALSGMERFDNAGIDNAFLSNLYATPQVDYERGLWRMSFRLPLKWMHYSLNGQHDYFNVSPFMSLHRKVGSKSEFSASLSYRLISPQGYLFLNRPVLSDYRNIFDPESTDRYSQEFSAGMSYRYRNPLRALFFNLSASYSHGLYPMIGSQEFIGDFIVSSSFQRMNRSDSWRFSGGISKGLGHSRMVVGCDVSASYSLASSMRDGEVLPYRQTVASVKPYFKGSLLRWLSTGYDASYQFSRLSLRGVSSVTHSLRQHLFATIIPNDRWQFTIGVEHYFTRFAEGNHADLCLLDASAVLNASRKVRISLTADNILNRRKYEYVGYGTLSRSLYSFAIRPRSILLGIQYRF